jgi:uncharacterized protein with PIN domain
MSRIARCPRCQDELEHTKSVPLPVYDRTRMRWQGVALLCPHCNTVLGTNIDPEAIISEILKGLKKDAGQIKFHI